MPKIKTRSLLSGQVGRSIAWSNSSAMNGSTRCTIHRKVSANYGANAMFSIYEFVTASLRSYSGVRIATPPVLEPVNIYFPEYRRFADAGPQIRKEALAIIGALEQAPRFHELMAAQLSISANDGRDWRMFVLKAYGLDVVSHMQACPALAKLLADSPQVLSATLSYLAPHKHIPPHRGPFKGIMRFHLMLSMPMDVAGKPAARLIIDGTEYLLREGEWLLWDDTFVHEVENDSDQPRMALLLDVRRPAMPIDMRIISGIVIFAVQLALRIKGISFSG